MKPQRSIAGRLTVVAFFASSVTPWLSSCQSTKSAPVYIVHPVYQGENTWNQNHRVLYQKEKFYLLYSDNVPELKNGVKLALQDRWEDARRKWNLVSPESNCLATNNLSVYYYRTGQIKTAAELMGKIVMVCESSFLESNFRNMGSTPGPFKTRNPEGEVKQK